MRILQVLKERCPGPVPIWMMRQAGRYLPEYRHIRSSVSDFLELCYTPELASRVTLQPVRRFGFDAAILFSDILVIPDALGQKVSFVEGEGPRLEPLKDAGDVAQLREEGVLRHLAPVLETVSRVRDELAQDIPLIGFCGAPWTVATYMIGGRGTSDQAPARMWAYQRPQEFAKLIDVLVESSIAYLGAQVKAGADVLQIFDSWAGNLPQKEFARWSVEPMRRIVAGVKREAPEVPVIIFPRGAGWGYQKAASGVGAEGLGIDTACDLDFARDMLQPLTVVQGNLDPLVLLAGGVALDEAVDDILAALGKRPFIFNLGHGILPQTPPDHVERVVKKVQAWAAPES